MPKPQQPELARNRLGSQDRDGTEVRAGDKPQQPDDHLAPVPEDNQPGHHPDAEQDKPDPPDEPTRE